jgi:hypothetical protein
MGRFNVEILPAGKASLESRWSTIQKDKIYPLT